jgi:hypothetical protein
MHEDTSELNGSYRTALPRFRSGPGMKEAASGAGLISLPESIDLRICFASMISPK